MRRPGPRRARWPILSGILIVLALAAVWLLWSPGLDVRDGRYDRGSNAIWAAHGWLGGDDWFVRYNKTNEFTKYRDLASIRALVKRLRTHHIGTIYPHLCPSMSSGHLPAIDSNQVERFLSHELGAP